MRGRRSIKNWILLAAVLLCCGIGITANGQSVYRNVDVTDKIYDYAGLFQEEEAAQLAGECRQIIEQRGFDVFVVTIDHNNIDYDSENRTQSFLEDFGDSNGFGLGKEKNYVAFIIDMDERNFSIDIKGDDCFQIYTDRRQQSILDSAETGMQSGDYASAAENVLSSIDAFAQEGPAAVSVGTEAQFRAVRILKNLGISVVIGLIVGLAVLFSKLWKHRNIKRAVEADCYMQEGSFRILKQEDQHLGIFKTYRKIEKNTGEDFGGNTTIHTSSGGSSHSGSGRSF